MPRAAPELLHLVANPLTEPRDRKSPEAPPRRFSPPRPPEIGLAAPLSSDLPRARFEAYWNRCELLILLPFSVFSQYAVAAVPFSPDSAAAKARRR